MARSYSYERTESPVLPVLIRMTLSIIRMVCLFKRESDGVDLSYQLFATHVAESVCSVSCLILQNSHSADRTPLPMEPILRLVQNHLSDHLCASDQKRTSLLCKIPFLFRFDHASTGFFWTITTLVINFSDLSDVKIKAIEI